MGRESRRSAGFRARNYASGGEWNHEWGLAIDGEVRLCVNGVE
jgi:hypothetical protein